MGSFSPFGKSTPGKAPTGYNINRDRIAGMLAANDANLTPAQRQQFQQQLSGAYNADYNTGRLDNLTSLETALTGQLADINKEVSVKRVAINEQLNMLQTNNAAKLQQKVNSFFGATQAQKTTNYGNNTATTNGGQ